MVKLISNKQYAVLAFMLTAALKMFMLPVLLLKNGGRDGYLSLFIMTIVEIVLLLLISFTLKLAGNKTFFDLLDKGAGKIGGRIIAALLCAYLLLKLTVILSEVRVFVTVTLSDSLQWWICAIPIALLLLFSGIKTARTIGRSAEIIAPFVIAAIALLIFLEIPKFEFKGLLPVLEGGVRPIADNLQKFPMWYGDIFLLLILSGKVQTKKGFMLLSVIASAIGGAVVVFLCMALTEKYNNAPGLLDYGHNISNMLLYTTDGYVIGRFDILVYCFWLFAVFIQLCLVFYIVTRLFRYVSGYKNNAVTSGVFSAAAYIITVFVAYNEYSLLRLCTGVVRYFSFAFMLFLPIFIFLTALFPPAALTKKRIKKLNSEAGQNEK